MNRIFRKLGMISHHSMARIGTPPSRFPFTLGINSKNEVVKRLDGKKTLDDFGDDVILLNVCHRNGKTTVIKRNSSKQIT